MKKILVLFVGLCCLLAVFSQATNRLVPSQYSTVSAAISAAVSGDTILVSAGTYVNDNINIIDKSLAIIGVTGSGDVIITCSASVIPGGVAPTATAGVDIYMSPLYGTQVMNVTLSNLIILPAKESIAAAPNKGIRPAVQALGSTTLNVYVNQVLECPNNGSDLPVSRDGLSKANLAGAICWEDDQNYAICEGASGNCNLYYTDCTITNNRPDTNGQAGAATSPDGFVIVTNAGDTVSMTGCVVSYNDRIGLQCAEAGVNYLINGTPAHRNLFLSNQWLNSTYAEIYSFDGVGIATTNTLSTTGSYYMSYTDIISQNGSAFSDIPTGGGVMISPTLISNCRMVSSNSTGGSWETCAFGEPAYSVPTITNCTFFSRSSTAYGEVHCQTLATTAVYVSNCVFAADTQIGSFNGTYTGGIMVSPLLMSGPVVITNCSIVTTGPNTLGKVTTGAGNVNISLGSGIIYSDPAFLSTNPGDEVLSLVQSTFFGQPGGNAVVVTAGGKFLNVTGAGYATAASGGTPLAGGAGYASGGNYLVWASNSIAIATLSSSAGNTAVFSLVTAGNATVTGTDVDGQVVIAGITATGVSAPLAQDADISMAIQSRKIETP